MTRIYVPPEVWNDPRIVLRGKDAHYVARVLRVRAGERIVLFDGAGGEADSVVVSVMGRAVELHVVARRVVRDENPLALTVVQAALQGEKAAWLVEKLTELGVRRVTFFAGERSVRARVDVDRLSRVAEAAARQSGRVSVPAIAAGDSLRAAIETLGPPSGGELRIYGEAPGERTGLALDELVIAAANHDAPHSAVIVVGSEAGLSEAETAQLSAAGFGAVRLGPRTLRAESAGFVFAVILGHRLGDLR